MPLDMRAVTRALPGWSLSPMMMCVGVAEVVRSLASAAAASAAAGSPPTATLMPAGRSLASKSGRCCAEEVSEGCGLECSLPAVRESLRYRAALSLSLSPREPRIQCRSLSLSLSLSLHTQLVESERIRADLEARAAAWHCPGRPQQPRSGLAWCPIGARCCAAALACQAPPWPVAASSSLLGTFRTRVS